MVFSLSLDALSSVGPTSRKHSALRRAPVHASIPRPGEIIAVPRDSISVLVQITDTYSDSVSIKTPNHAELLYMRYAADVCSLSTGYVATVQEMPISSIVQYDIPRSSFSDFAARRCPSEVNTFEVPLITSDAVLYLFSRSVGPLLGADPPPSKKFAQYFALSLYSHLAERYGTRGQESEPASGGFSPRNRRLIEGELLDSSGENISMEVLASRCGLSTRQFARAFQKSFGVPFYQFQLGIRIQRAKVLLTESHLPLRAIADQLGYADQATFTESFTRVVGLSPGRYRRHYVGATSVIAQVGLSEPAEKRLKEDGSFREG